MGRKKRKLATDAEEGSTSLVPSLPSELDYATGSSAIKLENDMTLTQQQQQQESQQQQQQQQKQPTTTTTADIKPAIAPLFSVATSKMSSSADDKANNKLATSSGYSMTTHSGEIVEEDIYVSEGSGDEDEYGTTTATTSDKEVEILLTGSRMGMMRRGLHHPLLVQSNRQWVRPDHNTAAKGSGDDGNTNGAVAIETEEEAEERRRRQEEEELAKLDPAQRAARLLAEKQRKLEEAKEKARMLESEENAGRDPCLFSKRTSFDIRFDSIEDKPWTRGVGDITDYFNYGLTEEDWMEYSQQQLMIRQELTEANRHKRPPDPTVVPVMPRTPRLQNPKVAVVTSLHDSRDNDLDNDDTEPMLVASDGEDAVVGPTLMSTTATASSNINERETTTTSNMMEEGTNHADAQQQQYHQPYDVPVGIGGAWGAGATPGSVLARLIEEQERNEGNGAFTETATAASEGDPYTANDMQSQQQENEGSQRSNYYADDDTIASANHYEQGNEYNHHSPPSTSFQQQEHYPSSSSSSSWRGGGGGGRRGGRGGGRAPFYPPEGGGGSRNGPPYHGGPPPSSFRGGRHGGGNNFYRGAPRPPYGMPPPSSHQQAPPIPPQSWAGGGGGRGGRGGRGDFVRKRPREDFHDDRWQR